MSDPTNKVPFRLIGDGTAVLRYRTKDLVALEQKYGLQFTTEITTRLSSNSHECLVECMRAGLKDAGGRKPFTRVDFDDLPFSIQDATPLIFDAIASSITGEPYAEILARQEEAAREAKADPQPSLETADSFDGSSRPDTPPVS